MCKSPGKSFAGCASFRPFPIPRPIWIAVLLILAASPLRSQTDTFEPTISVGGGMQTSYQHTEPNVGSNVDNFSLNHARRRLYFGGDITKYISVMFNTNYTSSTDDLNILVGRYPRGAAPLSPKLNVSFGRFLPPSDRATLLPDAHGVRGRLRPDGIQDGYPFDC